MVGILRDFGQWHDVEMLRKFLLSTSYTLTSKIHMNPLQKTKNYVFYSVTNIMRKFEF